MTSRNTLRSAMLAASVGLLPLVGCIGASSDKQGSGYEAGTGGEPGSSNPGTNTTTEQLRSDKGDNPQAGVGTAKPRPNDVDATKTGGLGERRDDAPQGPGANAVGGTRSEASGPK